MHHKNLIVKCTMHYAKWTLKQKQKKTKTSFHKAVSYNPAYENEPKL